MAERILLGILFLSTEGLYDEAMRRAGLAEFIQREYRIVLSGPSTLAALLNSLQMEVEDYRVILDDVVVLELAIIPDINNGNVRASLVHLRIG